MSSNESAVAVSPTALPAVPLTIEGSSVLHQMMRFRWADWRKLAQAERGRVLSEAVDAFSAMESEGTTAIFSVLGHKGDFMFIHFRPTFEDMSATEVRLAKLGISDFLEPTTSYVSMVELGLYDSTVKLYRSFAERGVVPHSEQWTKEIDELLDRQKQAMSPRLFPKIPDMKFCSFYPMDRRRGEIHNWYTLPIENRQKQMDEHGAVGRRYAGKVQQVISGSIGFDDWEWGVDLFGNDPAVFKKLIYEMRFDEVSGVYSNFGIFYLGVRVKVAELGTILG